MSGKTGLMWMVIGVLFGAGLPAVSKETAPAELTVAGLPLEDVIRIDDQDLIESGDLEIPLPPLSARPGKVIVLRLKAVSYAERSSGWHFNVAFAVNGNSLGRHTTDGDARLIGRPSTFFARSRDWELFSGFMIRIPYAPSVTVGDRAIPGGQASSFAFNISDVARGVDGNMLRISNIRRTRSPDPKRDLMVREIEIGWLDKSLLPKPSTRIPHRDSMKDSISVGGVELTQGAAGGFSIKSVSGVELMVETALSLDKKAESSLTADDATHDGVKVSTVKGTNGYQTTVVWPGMTLVRDLQLKDGMLHWTERWTNRGDATVALPFQHRLFLRDDPARFCLGGDSDTTSIPSSASNPTVFLGSKKTPGNGVGVTMENDWLRLLAGLRHSGGVAEIFSETASLRAGESIDFSLTVSRVENGGYWTFINDVRRRWGVNGGTAERPFFWNWAGKGAMTEAKWKRAFGHLGPVAVAAWPSNQKHPWMAMGFDVQAVIEGSYPKLPANVSRTPGKSPDLDVGSFLTLAHREPYWKAYADYAAMAHQAIPGIQIIHQAHPGIDAVYAPCADRWAKVLGEPIRTETGEPFNSGYYSHAFLKDAVEKDWVISYNVPREGSVKLNNLLSNAVRSMDECGSDGIYVDEFSWVGRTRGYSRYGYSCQDGYSADLDADGAVVRQKSDNAYTTGSAQVQIVNTAKERGKFFLGNGNAALRRVNNLHTLRFCEGGNGVGSWVRAHLATVPLILGNFGDQGKTSEGVFRSVKAVVENGCIYSPKECNLVLAGSDNFVCKQYPITIQELGPGVIKAEERLITTHSGAFDWPGRDATVVLYAYDKKGDLMERGNLPKVQVDANGPLKITVPSGGMVIAEITEQ